jgi:amino acid adenylation domain-containing protein
MKNIITISTEPVAVNEILNSQILIEGFNQTVTEYPRHRCAHELFEAQVRRTPEAIAVVFQDTQLTYRQLNARANQLAHRLRSFGVGPDSRVGICVERSPEMIVGLLAILKSGGAYVPMDPSYPSERLAFMLEDANILVLLTQASLIDKLPQHNGPRLCLDSDWESIKEEPTENLASGVTPENLAYLIFTSGSTGKPKGAMIRHQGLVNYLNWCIDAYDVAGGCGAPVHSSISFDLTVTSLFAPLMVGASVFLLADGIEALAQALLERDNYSLVKITPAHLRALAELMPPSEVTGRVRFLIIGGEALHFEGLSFWRQHAPATRLINEYGPTETVVGCCVYEIDAGDAWAGPVPIGRPIANTQLYVLDEELQPVPLGESGELYIGGDGVGRGYLNRNALTAERFIPDPFGESERARLYRTGDLARFLPDGNLEYLGRVDDQIKIKGFRIELGEIETTLKQYGAVSDCAVVACEEPCGEKRLTAFFVPNGDSAAEIDGMKDFLRAKLPDYMVPATFVSLDALPLTTNGKVDRRALTNISTPVASQNFDAARTPVEATLARIWAEVFNLEAVGVNDNFFDLGGDSILGTLILARAARAGVRLSPMQLFEHQTVAELSRVIG